MRNAFLFYCLILMLTACAQKKQTSQEATIMTMEADRNTDLAHTLEHTIATRFTAPANFKRVAVGNESFGMYLRHLPLKPKGSLVKLYNGQTKPNKNTYVAVIDLPIGKRDLHQCADAIMHLRANYLFEQKKYDQIHFNFTNGFKASYGQWRKGKRIKVNGNQVFWQQKAEPSDTYEDFWKYLEMVFSYAGTASLEKELVPTHMAELQIGDVFIQGGFPGHAVIVVDMATNQSTGETVFMLAQSYMPAQEIQVLRNPNNTTMDPWYASSEIGTTLRTPEWVFNRTSLKRFEQP